MATRQAPPSPTPATNPMDRTAPAPSPINGVGYLGWETKGHHIVANPSIGALSALNTAEYLAFQCLIQPDGRTEASHHFQRLGQSPGAAERATTALIARLEADGWGRQEALVLEHRPLGAVYFTITRECNLACPYCYQGLENRARRRMDLDRVRLVLDKIVEVNSQAHVIVTGGEPMMHPNFLEILDEISARGLSMSLLTNGVYLTREMALRLKAQPGLERVQVSLDGMSEETHALSRGPRSFAATREAILLLAELDIPFLLSPTIHDGNAHEILEMAIWAVGLGGGFSGNDLRHLPQDSNQDLTLSEDTLSRVRQALSAFLVEAVSSDPGLGERLRRLNTRPCSTDPRHARQICGVAHSLIDIDHTGEVYPCHLIKGEGLALGNILEQSVGEILAEGVARGWRTHSSDIEGCSSCAFTSSCGGGCRAKTYFVHGTPRHNSPTCEENGRQQVNRLLKERGVDV